MPKATEVGIDWIPKPPVEQTMFKCPYCWYNFSVATDCERHILDNHKGRSNEQ